MQEMQQLFRRREGSYGGGEGGGWQSVIGIGGHEEIIIKILLTKLLSLKNVCFSKAF